MPSSRLGRCALAVTAVLAVAALPGPAVAEDAPGPPPACAAGSLPTPEHPCMLPPCPAGVQPRPEAPCLRPLAPGPLPGSPQAGHPGKPGSGGAAKPGRAKSGAGDLAPDGTGRGDSGPDSGKGGGDGPRTLKRGFVSRVWRFTADADSYDATSNTLNVTVSKLLNVPKRFKAQDDDIVDQDADVIFTKKTKVYDNDGKRLRTESSYDAALDAAESVSVTGKIIPQAKWNKDEDGSPITTLRAKRVTITG